MIYSKAFIKQKIDRIWDLYDLSDPVDLFTIIPQEMELVEVRAMAYSGSGEEKLQSVIAVLQEIAKRNKVKLDPELLEVFISTIADATKGKFAINKEKQ